MQFIVANRFRKKLEQNLIDGWKFIKVDRLTAIRICGNWWEIYVEARKTAEAGIGDEYTNGNLKFNSKTGEIKGMFTHEEFSDDWVFKRKKEK